MRTNTFFRIQAQSVKVFWRIAICWRQWIGKNFMTGGKTLLFSSLTRSNTVHTWIRMFHFLGRLKVKLLIYIVCMINTWCYTGLKCQGIQSFIVLWSGKRSGSWKNWRRSLDPGSNSCWSTGIRWHRESIMLMASSYLPFLIFPFRVLYKNNRWSISFGLKKGNKRLRKAKKPVLTLSFLTGLWNSLAPPAQNLASVVFAFSISIRFVIFKDTKEWDWICSGPAALWWFFTALHSINFRAEAQCCFL